MTRYLAFHTHPTLEVLSFKRCGRNQSNDFCFWFSCVYRRRRRCSISKRKITCARASVSSKRRRNNLTTLPHARKRDNSTHRKSSQKTLHCSQTDAPAAHEAPRGDKCASTLRVWIFSSSPADFAAAAAMFMPLALDQEGPAPPELPARPGPLVALCEAIPGCRASPADFTAAVTAAPSTSFAFGPRGPSFTKGHRDVGVCCGTLIFDSRRPSLVRGHCDIGFCRATLLGDSRRPSFISRLSPSFLGSALLHSFTQDQRHRLDGLLRRLRRILNLPGAL